MTQDEILAGIEQFAHEFAERRLRPYIERITKPSAIGTAPKEINDAIWGTIKISPLEVVILDCPLVQRLRFVRQLGVVHWVYPGATHSRFEHTLGVLHQSQQLVNAINHASDQPDANPPIDAQKAAVVRLCAILHDIGHGVFSHVSEHAIGRRVELKFALQKFALANNLNKIQLSELVAYHLVGSPAFQEMLATAFDALGPVLGAAGGARENAAGAAALVQKAIVGKHIDEQVPLLHEIITGPFDADKLDYYARDAKHAGIPSTLDISRLLQKITTKRIASRDMPEDILRALSEHRDTRDLFGLKWSGKAILDELHLSRVLLYAKIYRHKKVSAIEAMIDALFEALGSQPGVDVLKLICLSYELSDDQLLLTDSSTILAMLGVKEPKKGLGEFVDMQIARLRDRDLYISSLALMAAYPGDPWGKDKQQARGLDGLMAMLSNEQQLAELRRDLTTELRSIAALIPESIGGLDPETLEYAVVISAKPPLGSGTEIDRALILSGEKFVRGRELEMNQTAWADAYDTGKPQGVFFAPRECAAAVYVAAERFLRVRYDIVLPASAVAVSKQNSDEIDDLKRQLEKRGWYSGVPHDIRAVPERMLKQDIDVVVERIAAKLALVDEPQVESAQRRAATMPDRVKGWLAQFRDDEHIDCALAALDAMKVLSREDSVAALKRLVEDHPQFKGATICPLGDIKDSGSVQTYIAQDLRSVFPEACTIAEAAQRGGDKPIIFIDDFTGSGSQALDILGNWFSDDALKQAQLGEQRLPFGEGVGAFLRARPVAFLFVAGWADGLKKISAAAKKLKLDATVFCHLVDSDLPFAFDRALPGCEAETLDRFRERCRGIGADLLASTDRDAKKQQERALGYGNRAMLLASRFNVPTQTLTCIWLDGQHDGVEWHALLRRRPKA